MTDAASSRVRNVLAQRLQVELAQVHEVISPDGTFYIGYLGHTHDTHAWSFADAFAFLESKRDDIVTANERTMTMTLEKLVEQQSHCAAIFERSAHTWPWFLPVDARAEAEPKMRPDYQLHYIFHGARLSALSRRRLKESELEEALMPWSADVAPREVVEWVAAGIERTHRGGGRRYIELCERAANELKRDVKPESITVDDGSEGGIFLHGQHLACLCAATKAVERDRRVPAFKVSATRPSSAAVSMLAAGAPKRRDAPAPWTKAELTKNGEVVLYCDGKRRPMQMVLYPNEGESLEAELTRSILTEFGEDGLRDWLVLHRMASDQGGTGTFRWSWDEHRHKTHYMARIANKNATEADLARNVRQRLGRLKRAEIWLEARRGDKVVRRRVGPFGLLDIEAELFKDHGQTPMVVSGRINPEIYKGARGSVFTLLPEAILARPIAEVRLLTLASFPWRAGDEKGVANLRAKTLWDYAGIRAGKYTDPRRFTAARSALERLLQNLAKHAGITFSGGGDGPDTVYRLTAPTWWLDRVVHGIGPVLATKATLAVPRTGAELAAMRKVKALTLRAVADVVGASAATVMRAEGKASTPLSPEWLTKLAAAGLTLDLDLPPSRGA